MANLFGSAAVSIGSGSFLFCVPPSHRGDCKRGPMAICFDDEGNSTAGSKTRHRFPHCGTSRLSALVNALLADADNSDSDDDPTVEFNRGLSRSSAVDTAVDSIRPIFYRNTRDCINDQRNRKRDSSCRTSTLIKAQFRCLFIRRCAPKRSATTGGSGSKTALQFTAEPPSLRPPCSARRRFASFRAAAHTHASSGSLARPPGWPQSRAATRETQLS
jgi:hypothetical protein